MSEIQKCVTYIKNGVSILAVGLAFFVGAMAQQPQALTPADPHQNLPVPSNVPVWTHHMAKQFPGCHDIDSRPDNTVPNRVIVVMTVSGKVRSMEFNSAWQARTTGRFFTVGYCV